jgi:hypothetical protein
MIGMEPRPSIIERAFQLAGSGDCADISDLRGRLAQEGYRAVESCIRGTALLHQLRYLISSSRTAALT